MSDSKNDIKETESNVTKTSPLIIRLCTKTPNTSPDVSSVSIKSEEISNDLAQLKSKYCDKGELDTDAQVLRNTKLNENRLASNKSLIGEPKDTYYFEGNKCNKSSVSNMLEDQVPKPKRRKLGEEFQEALEQSQSSELPLVMQSSNLHSDSGLDLGHDGGGAATTDSRTDVLQHSHDDSILKPSHSQQTLEKDGSGKIVNLKRLLDVKTELEELGVDEYSQLHSENPLCSDIISKDRYWEHSRKKIKLNENSSNTNTNKTENSKRNISLDVTQSALSSDKELLKNTNQDESTTVSVHLPITSNKDESFHNIDNISSHSSSHSLGLSAIDKPCSSKAAELKKEVFNPQKEKNSQNKSFYLETTLACPFKQFRKEKHEMDNSSVQSTNALQSCLSSIEETDTNDDKSVGYLEITELERMRESLRKQLSQDNDFELNLPTYSEKLRNAKAKMINIQKNSVGNDSNELAVNDKSNSNSNKKPSNANETAENNFEQKIDPHLVVPEKVLHSQTSSKELNIAETIDELTSVANTPPLVMQSSNILLNDGLDNKHGRGGKEESSLKLGIKQDCFFDIDDSKDKDDKVKEGETLINGKNVESDDSASNQAGNASNDAQNGMMEFDILDEFESDDNDGDEDSTDYSDISTDEIDAMLEEGLQRRSVDGKNKDIEHEEKEKVILKVRGRDHFDVLPEGWIEVTHNSGMPIYLHKPSRVCSVSKPYFLGPGSTRKHEIPVSAIPCLHYMRELEKEKRQAEEKEKTQGEEKEPNGDSISESGNENSSETKSSITVNDNEKKAANLEKTGAPAANGIILTAKLETVKDTKESGSLNYLDVRDYCKKRFEFQTITVKRFRTWSGRRKHQKQIKRKQRPFLPDSTKLITCPLLPSDKSSAAGNNTKREFIMNPSGKSPVCILHEYVQHTLRVQPKYIFKELESASTPYGAIVLIDQIEYGYGFGSSKKLAKSDAAKAALEILIPKMKMFSSDKNDSETQNVDFFDQVRVEDPRVCELSVKAGQPYPYQILLECLKRNYGMGDTEIQFMMKNLKHQKNEFYMKVGKHEISVVCKNKRDGKHRASQAILQKLHPHINSWGSLLRMYGKGSHKTMKEKKEEEQRITELQSQACVNKPNMSILNKLKEEMMKYREKVKSMKPIGKLIPERMECFSTSSSNLKNVEL